MPNDPLRIIRPNLYIPQSSGMEVNQSIIDLSPEKTKRRILRKLLRKIMS